MNTTTTRMIDTKTVKGNFHNDPRYGRTTKLVNRETGEVLGEFMGMVTRKDAYRSYLKQL